MQCPSTEIRVSCVYVLLIFSICMTFQSGSLKTMVLINGYWSILSIFWRCLHRLTLNLVITHTTMLMSTTQRFTQNEICFSLLGLGWKMTSSYITWTTESSCHPYMLQSVFEMWHPAKNQRQIFLSSLCSLVLGVGVISRGVNKVARCISLSWHV